MEDQCAILPVRPSMAEMRAAQDKLSRFYDRLADRAEGLVRRAAVKSLKPGPGIRALETGTGAGHALADLAEFGAPGAAWQDLISRQACCCGFEPGCW